MTAYEREAIFNRLDVPEGIALQECLWGMTVTIEPDDVRFCGDGYCSPHMNHAAHFPLSAKVADWVEANIELVADWVEELSNRIHAAARAEAVQAARYTQAAPHG